MHAHLGIGRVVLVQPSCYGTDNAAMLDAMRRLGQATARGIAVVDLETVTSPQLQELHAQGIRGLRLNFATRTDRPAGELLEEILKADAVVSPLGWSLHLHVHAHFLQELQRELGQLKATIVFDHFAGFKGEAWSHDETAKRSLHALLEGGRTYVKLSAPYRMSLQQGYADLQDMTREFRRAAPSRLLWGSDWPHTGGSGVRTTSVSEVEPFRDVDTRADLDLFAQWVGDSEISKLIFVDNPSRLFGFAEPNSTQTSSPLAAHD
jgi:predicted TIM-barrel fold metal-dependent hydrolase